MSATDWNPSVLLFMAWFVGPAHVCTFNSSLLATHWISCGMMRSPATTYNNKLGLRKFTCTLIWAAKERTRPHSYTHTYSYTNIQEIETMKSNHANMYYAHYERAAKHCYVTQCIDHVIKPYLCSIHSNVSFDLTQTRDVRVKFGRVLFRCSFTVQLHLKWWYFCTLCNAIFPYIT